MAVRILRSEITTKQVEIIQNALHFKSKGDGVFGGEPKMLDFYRTVDVTTTELTGLALKAKEKRVVWHSTAAKKANQLPIRIYPETKKYVDIPFMFAAGLYGKYHNSSDEHVRRYQTIDMKFTGKLRDKQLGPVKEAQEHLLKYNTTSLILPTGFGKTAIGAYLVVDLGLLTLVTYPRKTLGKQWVKTFESNTSARIWFFDKNPKPPKRFDVIVCIVSRIKKIPEYIINRVGVFIPDEMHMLCTANFAPLLSVHPKYIIAETATPKRPDDMEKIMYSIVGKHFVFRELEVDLKFTKVETTFQPDRKIVTRGHREVVDYSDLQKQIAAHKRRNKAIVKDALSRPNSKTLIFTRTKPHVMTLYKMLKKAKANVDWMAGTKEKYNNCQYLVATIAKLGTGFDEATCCEDYDGVPRDRLIITATMKLKSQITQVFGRVFRADNPNISMYFDNDETIDRHWPKVKSFLKEIKAEVTIEKLKLSA